MFISRCVSHVFGSVRKLSIAETSPVNNETLEELKRVDPRTGEKRIGNNFNYNMEMTAFAARLGYNIEDLPSLQLAFTHRSVVRPFNTEEMSPYHNSRLILLGRVTATQIVNSFLYKNYPNLDGGMMWDIATSMMNLANLNKLGESLGISELIISKQLVNEATIGKTFLAVIGTVYIDRGIAAAEKLVHQFIIAQFKETDMRDLIKIAHPNFMLERVLSSMNKPRPKARLLKETGRLSHFPTFVVCIYSGDQLLGEGSGSSLKRAQSEAAAGILRKHFMTELKQASLPTDYTDFKTERNVKFEKYDDENVNKEKN